MTELRYIFKYVKDLLSNTEETWTRMRDPNLPEGQIEYLLRYFYWPLLGVGAICIFLLHGNGVMLNSKLEYDDPFSFETGLRGMVSFVLGYAAAPSLASLIIREVFCRLSNMEFDRNRLDVFVHYCISIVMLVELLCAFLPTLTFISFIGLYTLYIVWLGAAVYLEISSSTSLRFFVFVSFLAIYFSSDLLQGVLHMLFAR